MATYYSDVKCPHCKKHHEVDFYFCSPDDGDIENEEVQCSCGAVFTVECEAEVDIYFSCKEPELISRPSAETEPDEEYHSNDPNQLSLL